MTRTGNPSKTGNIVDRVHGNNSATGRESPRRPLVRVYGRRYFPYYQSTTKAVFVPPSPAHSSLAVNGSTVHLKWHRTRPGRGRSSDQDQDRGPRALYREHGRRLRCGGGTASWQGWPAPRSGDHLNIAAVGDGTAEWDTLPGRIRWQQRPLPAESTTTEQP